MLDLRLESAIASTFLMFLRFAVDKRMGKQEVRPYHPSVTAAASAAPSAFSSPDALSVSVPLSEEFSSLNLAITAAASSPLLSDLLLFFCIHQTHRYCHLSNVAY